MPDYESMFSMTRWHWMNYGMSADFLEYYAEKYPEPPEQPCHSNLKTILAALREGEEDMNKTLRSGARWRKVFNEYRPSRTYKDTPFRTLTEFIKRLKYEPIRDLVVQSQD